MTKSNSGILFVARCLLKDSEGQIHDTREMNAEQFIDADREAHEQSAGLLYWTLDLPQKGFEEFEVTLVDSQARHVSTFRIKMPNEQWVRRVYCNFHSVYVYPVPNERAEHIRSVLKSDYKCGYQPEAIADKIMTCKMHPSELAYVVLDIASYMTDGDELRFRSRFAGLAPKATEA